MPPALDRPMHLLATAAMAYGLGVDLLLAARLVAGERLTGVAIFNDLSFWMLTGCVALLALALVNGWLVVALAPGVVAFALWFGPELLDRPPAPSDVRGDLRVVTFNVLFRFSDPDRVAEILGAVDADIVGIQEAAGQHVALLRSAYPHTVVWPAESPKGVALASRHPIVASEVFETQPDGHRAIRAELDVDGRRVVVFVAHPSVPRYGSRSRTREVDGLLERIRAETEPTLVLGDCNLTPRSEDYARLAEVLEDSWAEAGRGPGWTWPVPPGLASGAIALLKLGPILRIDYVWHTPELPAVAARVWPARAGSDHLPVVVDLAWRERRAVSAPPSGAGTPARPRPRTGPSAASRS